MIPLGATGVQVQAALNDLPILSPNLVVAVETQLNEDGVSLVYFVKFAADLGEVPELQEISGNVNSTITIYAQASLTGTKTSLVINSVPTALFSFNDSASTVIISLAIKNP